MCNSLQPGIESYLPHTSAYYSQSNCQTLLVKLELPNGTAPTGIVHLTRHRPSSELLQWEPLQEFQRVLIAHLGVRPGDAVHASLAKDRWPNKDTADHP
ncbi:uncharacterized protein EMH_0086550 [Eimeria mitis]|uniref:Uncharacterized protein n=1 Tax=Eimeria mitis TaxID=44415 RepID=U6KLZ4_9EIME|nr:uncharacterized protein EMH_0086550 [Eimeria mitis]CDJ36468.1 hypothetical protein EMH_0086550 [Eimeria mitis]